MNIIDLIKEKARMLAVEMVTIIAQQDVVRSNPAKTS